MKKTLFALAVVAVAVAGIGVSGCGTQCPTIGFSGLDNGCEVTAAECSDQIEYRATCFGDGNFGFQCRCFQEGVSGVDDVFFSEDICGVDDTDAALKLANIGCDWQISDPT